MSGEQIVYTNSKGKEKVVPFDDGNLNHHWARAFYFDVGPTALAFGPRGNTTYQYKPAEVTA